ncbi:hypothetical protein K437DRAFT_265306 [Tilletiaria anomala UBC 951]|uniref:Dilute domain-containing protein n=1 Tax=Tilletiaria anomala (strain ATCC 24038 / CBS 436.72 / UBC 951) TaxID=1037660 RepID=A0A066V814_TILAU|nr:uncharacterized protein K437DRAFT_265306 [Tilletiaria anomala UBC 951]KDN36423.1 hypothetical protein K437DRAFT_265306 [Tilletiaria anomala UBC 951]
MPRKSTWSLNMDLPTDLTVDPVATAVELSAQLAEVTSSTTLSATLKKLQIRDPILDLCPSVDFLLSLAALPDDEMSHDEKRARLSKALLRAAGMGDTDVLTWIVQPGSPAWTFLPTTVAKLAAKNSPGTHPSEAERSPCVDFSKIRDDDGVGPVVLASSSGNLEAVRLLIREGADVNERDACGWTPLMWAANSSNVPLVAFLLSRGADPEARSHKGTSCEDFILSVASEQLSIDNNAMSTADRFASSFYTVASSSRQHSSSPATAHRNSDREVIADMILEHQKAAAKEKRRSMLECNVEVEGLHGLRINNSEGLTKSSVGSNAPTPARTLAAGSLLGSSQATDERPISPMSAVSSSEAESGTSAHIRLAGLRDCDSESDQPSSHRRTTSLASAGTRRLLDRSERVQLAEQELRARELAEGRKRALLDIATMLSVDFESLVGNPPPTPPMAPLSSAPGRSQQPRRLRKAHRPAAKARLVQSALASGCGAIEVGADPLLEEFDFEKVRHDQMLVFASADLPLLKDLLVKNARPVRAPWTARAMPANVLFLCARYACAFEGPGLLDELMKTAINQIEDSIYEHQMDMVWLVFWMSNTTLLLHYFLVDATLSSSEMAEEYQGLLTDLINEIYVFIIRDAERRIDNVLDTAMLEYESLPGTSEARFEGDWNFMKNLAGSVKNMGSSSPQRRPLSQIFSGSNSPRGPTTPATNGLSISQQKAASSSPSKRAPSELNLLSVREASYNATADDLLAYPSPRTVTSLLTSTLQVMQLYEINPAIIVQVLSQIIFWVGCELFNRILANKKYLCRSKAMQIRLNVSALEDWARNNALPLAIVHQHLAPLSQLVSWLQCQSALLDFDALITTMQNLRALNPLQLRRTVRDYRYEVNETRMSEECSQYLLQLHEDWMRSLTTAYQRWQRGERQSHGSGHFRSGTATQQNPRGDPDVDMAGTNDAELADLTLRSAEDTEMTDEERAARHAQMSIDALFEPGNSMADYMPSWTPLGRPGPNGEVVALSERVRDSDSTAGEALNSREMLPFALPTGSEALTVSPGDAFNFGRGHFNGTGTPSLKSLHALSSRFNPASLRSSLPTSPRIPGMDGSQSSGRRREEDTESVASSSNTRSSASSRQSLYPTGHGFGAGASWRPVPLLPEGLLEQIDHLSRAHRRVTLEHRPPSSAFWDSPSITFANGDQLPTRPVSDSTQTERDVVIGESGDDSEPSSDDVVIGNADGGLRHAGTIKSHARKVSHFSAKPLRLVVPDKSKVVDSIADGLDGHDMAFTPVSTWMHSA